MYNAEYYSKIQKKWEQFIDGGIDLSGIRIEVAESWRRSRSLQIDPYIEPTRIDKIDRSKLIDDNLYLLEIAKPYLDMASHLIEDTGFIIVLTDGDGIVIALQGDDSVVNKAKKGNFRIGACRSEKAVGTNAIGLAILEDKPVQVVGPEHYNVYRHTWTCFASPIHNSQGKVIGVLNASGSDGFAHKHTLAMIASFAQSIEKELIIQESRRRTLVRNNSETKDQFFGFHDIIGTNSKMKKAIEIAMRVAPTDTRVLLEGESGTGKELFAQAIHNASERKGNFIALNCSAVPKELVESELFGYSDGAFTGAKKGGKPGKFELANHGTLFLDEINSMPMDMQAKLLRVLQQNEVTRIGASHSIQLDVRVISACNEPLEYLVEKGEFRNDLYYRLAVVSITIPPLRERIDDLPILFESLMDKICTKLNKDRNSWTDEVIQALSHYNWPGNIRELENFIERAIILADNDTLTLEHFPNKLIKNQPVISAPKSSETISLKDAELDSIKKALEFNSWNITKAARNLGISRNTLYSKMRNYHISKDHT